jgi:carbamoyl-phosphate synthase large subunit
MEIVYSDNEILKYMESAVQVSPKHPVLVDKYIRGKEVEVDAIGDGKDIFIPGIMEHIERAGVHSGDSIAVYPPQTLSKKEIDTIVDYTLRIGRALKICGLINIQFVVGEEGIFVLEVNPRASRTVPVLSKVTGVPMVQVATRAMLGRSLESMGYRSGLGPLPSFITVKAPVFSFDKMGLVEISLGPEMKSTGEVMGIDRTFPLSLYKAMISSGLRIAPGGTLLVSLADRDKEEALPIIRRYRDIGFKLYATSGTAGILAGAGFSVEEAGDSCSLIRSGAVSLVINTPTRGKIPGRPGFNLRRTASEYRVPCLTSLDTARALAGVLESISRGEEPEPVNMRRFNRPLELEAVI